VDREPAAAVVREPAAWIGSRRQPELERILCSRRTTRHGKRIRKRFNRTSAPLFFFSERVTGSGAVRGRYPGKRHLRNAMLLLLSAFLGLTGDRWTDCTADASSHSLALRHAWLSRALSQHPDKGGSAEGFMIAKEAREHLRSDLRYFVQHARRRHLGNGHPTPPILSAKAAVTADADGWPRLEIEASFVPPPGLDLGVSHGWRIALASPNGSIIEYLGPSAGGYDVCCNFVRASQCQPRPRNESAARPAAAASRQKRRAAAYIAHDCPLASGEPLHVHVTKPLHRDEAGEWAAVLIVGEGAAVEAPPVACVSVAFTL